jgi:tRNA threonylcarbamoyladenosine biosynthesis protein TsaB
MTEWHGEARIPSALLYHRLRMIVLIIDTCGATGSVALGRAEDDVVSILAQAELAGKTYAAQLVPVVRNLLAAREMGPGTLNAIVIVNGPGSFTGIRIGVSSAKGLAEALGIPLLCVSRLAVLAWKGSTESAAFDAGRGEYYFRTEKREYLLTAQNAEASKFPDTVAICEESLSQVFPSTILVEAPTAADAFQVAAPELLAGEFADVTLLDGNYVRLSDAEIFSKAAGKA